MKKLLTYALAILMLVPMFGTTVDAKELNESGNKESIYLTYEPSMPDLSSVTTRGSYQQKLEALNEKRTQWLNSVIAYNENLYDQKVLNVEENSDKYVLYFEVKAEPDCESVVHDYELSGIEELDEDRWGVSRIEYVKPESYLASSMAESNRGSTVTVDGVTYDYKFTYYYAWSNGYYKVQKKSFTSYLAIAVDAVIAYTTDGANVLVSWVIAQAAGSLFNTIDQNKAITAETYNKYYYENKVCSIKATGTTMWYPTCQIGRRLDFGWSWSTAKKKTTGEPIVLKGVAKNGNGTPPTNYDSQAKKSHYNDDIWMAKKAIETMHTGGYVDIYAICTNQRP